jgi:diaminopimelate decarboxylase
VKFGIWKEQALQAYDLALKAGVTNFGIQMHIGSGIMEIESYLKAVKRLLEIAKIIKNTINISFDFFDLGGGFGVPYHPDEKGIDFKTFSATLFSFIKEKLSDLDLDNLKFGLNQVGTLLLNQV